jgi:hypothetical protein
MEMAAVRIAATTMEIAATATQPNVNYSLQCVLIAEKKPKYLSNPARVDQCTAVIVTEK